VTLDEIRDGQKKFGFLESDANINKVISDMDKNSDNAIELNELLEHVYEDHTGTPPTASCPVNMHMSSTGVCEPNSSPLPSNPSPEILEIL